ncbi:uncharacterized protein C8Q71DRAFT_911796 [Rhodofomes roseus]|uniref:Uncharacterized protein n=1 Tax=Rhodofomes roseus TaxID=34475 RepID=A0ABQ8JZ48_9APHY|nr:uncharacterized protein C8Q71DRAFT_911796 [Rhodofomes roseus]KAH9829565.1 hypothetical protein C8Q71DRAFT_911796 [Rhodofomes roseus]
MLAPLAIIAQNVGFCVYKGLLSASSKEFENTLTLARPSEHPADCPMVHVTDTAAEMRSLLTVLLDARRYLRREHLGFEDVANCVRLAHKYVIKDLLDDSLEEIQKYFPSTFWAWERRKKTPKLGHAIIAVNLARLTDTTSILPAALYVCCQMGGSQIIRGMVRRDGVVETLASDDVERCIDGKIQLSIRASGFIHEVFSRWKTAHFVNGSVDSGATRCCRSATSLQAQCYQNTVGLSNLLGSRGSSIRAAGSAGGSTRLCARCISLMCEKEANLREALWSELPRLFGLVKGGDIGHGEDDTSEVDSDSSLDDESDSD